MVSISLKKHLKEGYLFNKDVVNSFSEGDYVVKFWAPLIEKIFRNTGTIPHWYGHILIHLHIFHRPYF